MKRHEYNRLLRRTLDITGGEMAKRVEVTRQTIVNYESGRITNYKSGRGVSRIVERVIELELDLAIEKCDNELIKSICEQIRDTRNIEFESVS